MHEEPASEPPVLAVEAPAPEPAPWAPESAKAFLARRLDGGEAVAAATLTHEAAAYGFTERALRHAKQSMAIAVFQKDRAWWWRMQPGR
jgi:hypothetical protein